MISQLRGRVRSFAEALCREHTCEELEDLLQDGPNVEDLEQFDLTPAQWQRGVEEAIESLEAEEEEDDEEEE